MSYRHELLDCKKTPLKRYLFSLFNFHKNETQLRHFHKRTNPGSPPSLSFSVPLHLYIESFVFALIVFFLCQCCRYLEKLGNIDTRM